MAIVALSQFSEYAFKSFDLNRLEASVFADNYSSAKVLLKCGFEPYGYAKKAAFKENQLLDLHLFEKLQTF